MVCVCVWGGGGSQAPCEQLLDPPILSTEHTPWALALGHFEYSLFTSLHCEHASNYPKGAVVQSGGWWRTMTWSTHGVCHALTTQQKKTEASLILMFLRDLLALLTCFLMDKWVITSVQTDVQTRKQNWPFYTLHNEYMRRRPLLKWVPLTLTWEMLTCIVLTSTIAIRLPSGMLTTARSVYQVTLDTTYGRQHIS